MQAVSTGLGYVTLLLFWTYPFLHRLDSFWSENFWLKYVGYFFLVWFAQLALSFMVGFMFGIFADYGQAPDQAILFQILAAIYAIEILVGVYLLRRR